MGVVNLEVLALALLVALPGPAGAGEEDVDAVGRLAVAVDQDVTLRPAKPVDARRDRRPQRIVEHRLVQRGEHPLERFRVAHADGNSIPPILRRTAPPAPSERRGSARRSEGRPDGEPGPRQSGVHAEPGERPRGAAPLTPSNLAHGPGGRRSRAPDPHGWSGGTPRIQARPVVRSSSSSSSKERGSHPRKQGVWRLSSWRASRSRAGRLSSHSRTPSPDEGSGP